MSKNKWTKEQQAAITEKNANFLVAAAAGAGKTAVLVERIIRKITDHKNPIDIDRLLIVTFTNAAATEMRERIADAISERLEKTPDSNNILRQLTLLGKANITTIHSFCLEVIRNHFQKINIDPAFRIADETESTLMKLEALNEVFEEQYENGNDDFFNLLECYGGNRDDQALQNMVLDLYTFVQSDPWPEDWLNKNIESLDVSETTDFSQTPWGQALLSSVVLELKGLKAMLVRAIKIIKNASGLEKYESVYREDLKSIDRILDVLIQDNDAQWDYLYQELQLMGFKKLPGKGKDVDKSKQEVVKKIRDDVKAKIKRLQEKVIIADSSESINDLKAVFPQMKHLALLVRFFSKKYAEKKNKKSVVDFNDLEHFCLDILSVKGSDDKIIPSEVALDYKERFEEILVDEYQDSNLVQEIIIHMISKVDIKKPNVFMVGDVKQSIYRFRQAKPELFLDKYNKYSSEQDSLFRKILLYKNFRSRKEIVDAVNFIFKQIMSASVGELDYTDAEALHAGAVFLKNKQDDVVVGGETELHLIQTGKKDGAENEADDNVFESQDNKEMLDRLQCEARMVGKRILELMMPDKVQKNFFVYDKRNQTYRRIKFRDIVILLRTTRNWADVFGDELSNMGIPSFTDTGTGFFKTIEVQVVLSLLKILDNPLQDIPLLAVLRSPIVGFTTDELAELRLTDKQGTLFEALQNLGEIGQGSAAQKAKAFLYQLKDWRAKASYMPTDKLIWQLYQDTGYYGMAAAMPAGKQRQANLRVLFERARQFEKTSYRGLFNFIHFIDRLKSSQGDMGSAKILGENDDVVRIMSIHKSKGLEFPVVILSGCGKQFNLQDMNKRILFHHDLGIGPDVVDEKLRLSWPSIVKQAIREKIKIETLSEEMRILYVAMTRAKEKLIITGSVGNIDKSAQKWVASAATEKPHISEYEILKGANYLDWIAPAVIRHKDCFELRNRGINGESFPGLLIEDVSKWHTRIWDRKDISENLFLTACNKIDIAEWLDHTEPQKSPELSKEITRRLSWHYKHSPITKIPAKVSVTELKRRFQVESLEEAGSLSEDLPALIKKPMFLEKKKGLTYAEKGTALHFVMQHLNFHQDIEEQIAKMMEKDLLTRQQAESIPVDKIYLFLKSSLGKRMLASKNINREVPFNIEIPCDELYKDMGNVDCRKETVLLQGVIDCFFEEEDGMVLLDYKTDYVTEDGIDTIKEKYKVQINYYARALEMLSGKKIKGKCIYLFGNNNIIKYE